jgi:hypothetical protein
MSPRRLELTQSGETGCLQTRLLPLRPNALSTGLKRKTRHNGPSAVPGRSIGLTSPYLLSGGVFTASLKVAAGLRVAAGPEVAGAGGNRKRPKAFGQSHVQAKSRAGKVTSRQSHVIGGHFLLASVSAFDFSIGVKTAELQWSTLLSAWCLPSRPHSSQDNFLMERPMCQKHGSRWKRTRGHTGPRYPCRPPLALLQLFWRL